ncbi:MAG: hypothetical protein RBR15_13005 [Sphaerochaeta sp.]|nr:hypothetical protein [Sphaerochaeta sp.]
MEPGLRFGSLINVTPRIIKPPASSCMVILSCRSATKSTTANVVDIAQDRHLLALEVGKG